MSMVQQAIEVSAPLHTVYEQLAAFENYPRFMSGVQAVTPIGHDQTHWIMDVDGKRREFDAQITERSIDQRVSWATTEGPLLAETITVRPIGETKTQVVAQLEADIAFLMPSGRHGQASLTRRLKDDLNTFKTLLESGALGGQSPVGASSKQLSGRAGADYAATPASVAARIRGRGARPGAGWDAGAAEPGNANTVDLPHRGITRSGLDAIVDDVALPGGGAEGAFEDDSAPGRRIVRSGPITGSAAGIAEMGGRTTAKDTWGDGMINEEHRGSHDR